MRTKMRANPIRVDPIINSPVSILRMRRL